MNCVNFWSRASERPLTACSSRLHCPILSASRDVEEEFNVVSPRARTAADDTVSSGESDSGTWRSDSPTSIIPDLQPSELTVFARHEIHKHKPGRESRYLIEHLPSVDYQERRPYTNGRSKSRTARVNNTRRVHFSPVVSYESWDESGLDHERTCHAVTISGNDPRGRVNMSPELAKCSTFPLTPRCGPSNNNYEEDTMHSSSSNDSSDPEFQPFLCNLGMRQNRKLPKRLAEPPITSNIQVETNARMHSPHNASCMPRLGNMDHQGLGFMEHQAESQANATNLDRGKWQTPKEGKHTFPPLQSDLFPTDIDLRTSLRNCSNLLQPELEWNRPTTTITANLEKPGDPSGRLHISRANAFGKVGSSVESVADLSESPYRNGLGNDQSWSDQEGSKNANRDAHKHPTIHAAIPAEAACPTAFEKYRRDVLNKPFKSSYWFDVPYSTDADLPAYLLRSRNESIDPGPDPGPPVHIASPKSRIEHRLSGGNKASKRSHWFDAPHSDSDPKSPAYLLPLEGTSETTNSELVGSTGGSTGGSTRSRRRHRLSRGNKASKSSYWFDVPYSADASLPAYLLQTGRSSNSEPALVVGSPRSTSGPDGSDKASKSTFWFDVPYSTDADLPAYLMQDTQNSERVGDVVRSTRSFRVSSSGKTLETPQPRKDPSFSTQALDAQELQGRPIGTVCKTAPVEKTYPGEMCPSFVLCPGDIMMTRNLREERNKIGGHVTVFPESRYFEERGIAATDCSVYYQFTRFDMVLRLGRFDESHDKWSWVPSSSFSLFMYAPLEQRQSPSWWLVDSKPSIALPAPNHNLDAEANPLSLNSRVQLAARNTDLIISTIPDPGLACKKRWTAHWGSPLFLPITQDVLVRAYYGRYSSGRNAKTETNSSPTWATVELYSYCGDSVAAWRFLGRDRRCYGPSSGTR